MTTTLFSFYAVILYGNYRFDSSILTQHINVLAKIHQVFTKFHVQLITFSNILL